MAAGGTQSHFAGLAFLVLVTYWEFHPHLTNQAHPGLKHLRRQSPFGLRDKKMGGTEGAPQSLGKDPEAAASIKWDYYSLVCVEHTT